MKLFALSLVTLLSTTVFADKTDMALTSTGSAVICGFNTSEEAALDDLNEKLASVPTNITVGQVSVSIVPRNGGLPPRAAICVTVTKK